MKRLSILLFVVLFSCMTTNAQTTIKDALRNYTKFKRQAETFADENEWVSFKYKDITYSAKGIFNAIDVNWWECYYLISPDKKVVYRAEKLEDYSEIINKLKLEN